MEFLIVKSLHIVAVVSWFAGLLYLVRLFIYHTDALNSENEPQRTAFHHQFHLMERRLWWGITVPAMVLTLVFGIWMLLRVPAYWSQGWLHFKLFWVLLLLIYHFACGKIYKNLSQAITTWSSKSLRIFNEIGTILLFAIVFTVVLKNNFYSAAATLVVVAAGTLLFLVIGHRARRQGR